jgi:hypothetical protein
MLTIHQRMAELWTIRKTRGLTPSEQDELHLCLEANTNFVWKKLQLENLSLLASMTHDHEWLHDLCARMEQMEPKQ